MEGATKPSMIKGMQKPKKLLKIELKVTNILVMDSLTHHPHTIPQTIAKIIRINKLGFLSLDILNSLSVTKDKEKEGGKEVSGFSLLAD